MIKNNFSNYSIVNVMNFGVVADGVTDNTQTLQNIVNSNLGKTIFFPSGVYLFSQLVIPSNTSIKGEVGSILKHSGKQNEAININNADNISISDIKIQGISSVNRLPNKGNKKGILLKGTSRVRLQNIAVVGFDDAGLFVTYQGADANTKYYQNLMVLGCRFEKNYHGIYFGTRAEYAIVSDTTCGENRIGILNSGGNNQFTGCMVNSNYDGFHEIGTGQPNSSHHSVTGCQFNHNGNYSLFIDGANVGVMFTGCQFFDGKIRFIGMTDGIIFTGCEGGTWQHISEQSGKVLFTSCYFYTQPTIKNNGNTIYSQNLPTTQNLKVDLSYNNDLVRSDMNNTFIGTNIFNDLVISKKVLIAGSNFIALRNGNAYMGHKDVFVNSNEYIGYIMLALYGNGNEKTLKAKVFCVDYENNTVLEQIADGTFNVNRTDSDSSTGISLQIDLNRSFSKKVYFIVWVERNGSLGLAYTPDGNNTVTLSNSPLLGDIVIPNTRNTPEIKIFKQDSINVYDKLKNIK